MTNFFHWIKHEIIIALPAIIFFAIAFNIVYFAEGLILNANDVRYTSLIEVNVGAIIIGKIIIIANALPFINAFPNKPLIHNIAWKTFIYVLVAFLFQLLDNFVKHSIHLGSIHLGYAYVKHILSIPNFWSIQIMVAIFFVYYVTFAELTRVLGKQKMKNIMLGTKT